MEEVKDEGLYFDLQFRDEYFWILSVCPCGKHTQHPMKQDEVRALVRRLQMALASVPIVEPLL